MAKLNIKTGYLARHVHKDGLSLLAVPHVIAGKPFWTFAAVEKNGKTTSYSMEDFAPGRDKAIGVHGIPSDFLAVMKKYKIKIRALGRLMAPEPVAPFAPDESFE